jgi:hypothetical protein
LIGETKAQTASRFLATLFISLRAWVGPMMGQGELKMRDWLVHIHRNEFASLQTQIREALVTANPRRPACP